MCNDSAPPLSWSGTSPLSVLPPACVSRRGRRLIGVRHRPDHRTRAPGRRPGPPGRLIVVHITLDPTTATDVVTGIRFPEGNRWHDGRLWYSDMHTGEVFSLDPATDDAPRLETTVDGQSSGLGWLEDGRLIVSAMESRTIVAVQPDGSQSVFADLSRSSRPSSTTWSSTPRPVGPTSAPSATTCTPARSSAPARSTSSSPTAPPAWLPTAWSSRTARTCCRAPARWS